MDNKTTNTSGFGLLATAMQNLQDFSKMVQTGEGIGLDENGRAEFVKQAKSQGAEEKIKAEIERIENLKKVIYGTQNAK